MIVAFSAKYLNLQLRPCRANNQRRIGEPASLGDVFVNDGGLTDQDPDK
jgi:hypothetical protein